VTLTEIFSWVAMNDICMCLNSRTSAIAETARVKIRSVMAVDRLALTVTLNMTYVNYISLIDLSMRGILYPVMLRQLTRYGCNMHMHCVPEKRDYVFDGKRNLNCPFTKCVTTLARVIVSIESTIHSYMRLLPAASIVSVVCCSDLQRLLLINCSVC